MTCFYSVFISFFLIFISELGDKTQLLVLSFSSKLKTFSILVGVALGSLLSHGIAILFGSFLGNTENLFLHNLLKIITFFSFIILGIITIINSSKNNNEENNNLNKFFKLKLGYILIITLSIALGEFGDKTFLSAVGLGISYPEEKIFLILGSCLGMISSNFFAILLGKYLNKIFNIKTIKIFSGILFLLFGFLECINYLF